MQSLKFYPILSEFLKTKEDAISIAKIAEAGSNRTYFRVKVPEKSYVLMLLPDEEAKQLEQHNYRWTKIAKELSEHNILVPKIHLENPHLNFLLMDDFGAKDLYSLSKPQMIQSFDEAFYLISKFLKITPTKDATWTDLRFDSKKYEFELSFFMKHLLAEVFYWQPEKTDAQSISIEIKKLSDSLSSFSKYFVHRDFHSQNLMVTEKGLGLIDFQDGQLGSPAYDLVSLCFDSYLNLSMDERIRLFHRGIQILEKDLSPEVMSEIKEIWPYSLLQRQLKALGSFGYLYQFKNTTYINHVPNAIETLLKNKEIMNLNNEFPFLSRKIPELIQKLLEKEKTNRFLTDQYQ